MSSQPPMLKDEQLLAPWDMRCSPQLCSPRKFSSSGLTDSCLCVSLSHSLSRSLSLSLTLSRSLQCCFRCFQATTRPRRFPSSSRPTPRSQQWPTSSCNVCRVRKKRKKAKESCALLLCPTNTQTITLTLTHTSPLLLAAQPGSGQELSLCGQRSRSSSFPQSPPRKRRQCFTPYSPSEEKEGFEKCLRSKVFGYMFVNGNPKHLGENVERFMEGAFFSSALKKTTISIVCPSLRPL